MLYATIYGEPPRGYRSGFIFPLVHKKGLEIIQALRGHTTGYSIPQYVIDAPGGGGKVPVNPDYVEKITDTEIVFKNYEGHTFRYPLTATPVESHEQPAGVESKAAAASEPERLKVPQDLV